MNNRPNTAFRTFLFFILLLISASGLQAQHKGPKLVVGIMVDQMRWDYLYRYHDRYGEDGFRRLLSEGFTCENTYMDFVPTYTAVGHSSVYTGSVPAIHGITGNDFIIKATGERMYCTHDGNVSGVGTSGSAGTQSPRNLLVSTITDQLKLATNFRSKVIGIAIKDRGGILPAGHFADAAYWYEGKSGNWISSTFYMETLPDWVTEFNAQRLPEKYLKQDWNTLYPIESYKQSIADDNPYERTYRGEERPVFPKKTSAYMADEGLGMISSTPYGNTLTLDLAKAAIAHEDLGNNPEKVTDFLALSFSSPDYIGHQFSVNSVEIEDMYLRLDRELADFFRFLDEHVGKGEYTVFLTADHGAAHNPRFILDQRGRAGYFNEGPVRGALNDTLQALFGHERIVSSLTNYQVHFDNALIREQRLDEAAIRKAAVASLREVEGVSFVADFDDIGNAAIPKALRERIINGYNSKRSGAIQFIVEPQWYTGSPRSAGTTHGTWSSYDAHIPNIWMGWGIGHGSTNRQVNMTDIASTVAALLKIEEPNGNIGAPIQEVLESGRKGGLR